MLDELNKKVTQVFRDSWTPRDGRVVPDPEDVQLSNDAVAFDRATVLYADLSGSTKLVDAESWQFAGEVYKTYLYCAARLIRDEGGEITSYDGDRIMGVFIGSSQSTPAARCALKINYAVRNIINPALAAQYPHRTFRVQQVVGIDTSEIRAARTGVRGGNDLVWIGRAANYAAKLTELSAEYPTWITKETFDRLTDDLKYGGQNKELMWKDWKWSQMNNKPVYSSTWWWKID